MLTGRRSFRKNTDDIHAMRIGKVILAALLAVVGVPLIVLLVAVAVVQVLDKADGVIVSSGDEREYLLHVPASYDSSEAVPLVVSLHAAAMWPAQQRSLSGWNRLADEHGFIVAYPSGRNIPKVWPDALGVGHGRDVRFIADLIDTISARYSVDRTRIYVNGMSNGGGMATASSCILSERIAAVGLVAAVQVVPVSSCAAVRPVPIIAFHGSADPMAPYNGGPLGDPFNPAKPSVPAVRDWVRDWARRSKCSDDVVESVATMDVSRMEYTGCADGAAVVLYTIHGGGHTWPGGKPLPKWLAGCTTTSLDATTEMWAFFVAHPLRSR
jgi:polyhydroxybutyrate depolymerase